MSELNQRLTIGALRASAATAGVASATMALVRLSHQWVAWTGRTSAADWSTVAFVAQTLVFGWGLGFSLLAMVIAWRAEPRRNVLVGALFFAGFSASFSGILLGGGAIPLATVVMSTVTFALGVRFAQLFPRTLEPADVSAVGPRWFRRSLAPLLAVLLSPWVLVSTGAAMEVVVHSLEVAVLFWGHVVVWTVTGAFYLYVGYRSADSEGRQRIFWVLEAALIFVIVESAQALLWFVQAVGLIGFDVGPWISWSRVIEGWAALGCLVFAIFFAGAFDSGLVLRRTAIASMSGLIALVIFVAVEESVSQIAVGLLGIESQIGAIVGGVLAALALQPIASRINRFGRHPTEPSQTG